MNTCKTCKHWSHHFDIKKGIADCDRLDCMNDEKAGTTFSIEATAHDDSGLQTWLMTGENFGCIHHDTKATNEPKE